MLVAQCPAQAPVPFAPVLSVSVLVAFISIFSLDGALLRLIVNFVCISRLCILVSFFLLL